MNPNISPTEFYQQGLREGKLRYQLDPDSGKAVFPPRLCAPRTGRQLIWKESEGVGVVYSYTVSRSRSGEFEICALVDMAEGYRMLGNVRGTTPDNVAIGTVLLAKAVQLNDSSFGVHFYPESE